MSALPPKADIGSEPWDVRFVPTQTRDCGDDHTVVRYPKKGRSDDEGPQHEITIPQNFAVSRFVVTFDQWDACVRDGGCALPGAGASSWGREKQAAISGNTWHGRGPRPLLRK
jgi:formylglycine-generating enzyme required for sulfatase activity